MDHRRRSLLALLSALGAGCVETRSNTGTDPGTTTEPTPTRGTPPDVGDEPLAALVAANTEFALALHRELVATSPGENLFVSPFSISAALAMTWAGARGETESAMADALRFPLDQDTLHSTFEALTAAVEPDESDAGAGTTTGGETTTSGESQQGFQLRVANALWGQEGFPFDESFVETLAAHYGAGMHQVNFEDDPETARQTINDWVADETEGKITDLLPEGAIDTLTRLVLTNAIYFKAKWAKTFEEDATGERSFTNLDGSTTEVPMMSQTESFPYAAFEGHRAVELPYVGGEVSMVVVLPAEGTFEEFERGGLDRDALAGLFDALETTPGTVALPRFTVESAFGLKDALSALGMAVAFDAENANFDGMIEEDADVPNLYVKDAVHKSFVDVDEEGTEAAAATGVVVNVESVIQPQFELTVDRPFLFFIRHRETDTILFAGRAVDAEGFGE